MFDVELAGLIIRIDPKYEGVGQMCREYIIQGAQPDLFISVTEDEILAEGTGVENPSYLETLAIYRKIAEWIVDRNGCLLHGVALEVRGKGIAFCAESGVGKSTHAMLWKQLLGEDCTIINGDKPLLRIQNGRVYAYGTPWCGKESLHKNSRTELAAICFLERSAQNCITELSKDRVLKKLLGQVYLPKQKKLLQTMDFVAQLMGMVRFYKLECTMNIEAAKTAYEGIFK